MSDMWIGTEVYKQRQEQEKELKQHLDKVDEILKGVKDEESGKVTPRKVKCFACENIYDTFIELRSHIDGKHKEYWQDLVNWQKW